MTTTDSTWESSRGLDSVFLLRVLAYVKDANVTVPSSTEAFLQDFQGVLAGIVNRCNKEQIADID